MRTTDTPYPLDGGTDANGHRWAICDCGVRVPVVRSWNPRTTYGARTVRYHVGWHHTRPLARIDPRRDSHWGGPVLWLRGTERLDRCADCPLAVLLRAQLTTPWDIVTGALTPEGEELFGHATRRRAVAAQPAGQLDLFAGVS